MKLDSTIYVSSVILDSSGCVDGTAYLIRGVPGKADTVISYVDTMFTIALPRPKAYYMDDSKVRKAGTAGNLRPGLRTFQRTPVNHDWPMHPGTTRNNTPDYCSVFEGPWYNNTVQNTSMPSLNALFHAFTITYIAFGVANNPHPSSNGIAFLIILGITAIVNWLFRWRLYCDNPLDIFVGAALGVLFGFAWFQAIFNWQPTWVYYGKEEEKGKCVLGKQKFQCTYD